MIKFDPIAQKNRLILTNGTVGATPKRVRSAHHGRF